MELGRQRDDVIDATQSLLRARRDEIDRRVVNCVTASLNVADPVRTDAVLHTDLGVQSIDMLDILFRLEREFDLTIDQHGITKYVLEEREANDEDRLTADELRRLRMLMPGMEVPVVRRLVRDELANLYTVSTLGTLVALAIAEDTPTTL